MPGVLELGCAYVMRIYEGFDVIINKMDLCSLCRA